jgi:hypothetical protein
MYRKAQWIAWPSFLMAGVLEMLVFTATDPEDLRGFGGVFAEMSTTGVYTISFFCFWIVVALASSLTLFLATPEPDSRDRANRWP